jgi:hypothetical protein
MIDEPEQPSEKLDDARTRAENTTDQQVSQTHPADEVAQVDQPLDSGQPRPAADHDKPYLRDPPIDPITKNPLTPYDAQKLGYDPQDGQRVETSRESSAATSTAAVEPEKNGPAEPIAYESAAETLADDEPGTRESADEGAAEPAAAQMGSADTEPAEQSPGEIADKPEPLTSEAPEEPDADVKAEDDSAESVDELTAEGPDTQPMRGDPPEDMELDDARFTDAKIADRETSADRSSNNEHLLAAGGPGSDGASDASRERDRQLKQAEREARKICRDHGARNVRVDYSRAPIDPACARDVNKSIDVLAKDYPGAFAGLKNIQTYGNTGNVDKDAAIAYSRPFSWDSQHGIYLNSAQFIDKGAADATLQRNEKNGTWVPAGGRAMDHVMYHEFGHVLGQKLFDSPLAHAELDQTVGQVIGRPYHSTNPTRGHFSQTADAIKGQLSKYGSTTPHEMVAEAFAEYKLSSNPRPLANAVGSLIDRNLKGK